MTKSHPSYPDPEISERLPPVNASKESNIRTEDARATGSGADLRRQSGEAPFSEFALADRRQRLRPPFADGLLLRARAHWRAGREEAAWRDLARAEEAEPNNLVVAYAGLEWGSPAIKRAAAERIVERRACPLHLRRAAVEALIGAGARVVHRLERRENAVAGWMAWSRRESLRLSFAGGPPTGLPLDADPTHLLASASTCAAEIEIESSANEAFAIDCLFDDGFLQTLRTVPTLWRGGVRYEAQPRDSGADGPFLTVIVPVYEDLAATRRCLESLEQARPELPHRIVVVDDASPNLELKAYVDRAAEAGRFELLRNPVNTGFAAAVNAALAQRTHGDALLLNADTIVAPGAIDRLAALGRSSPSIGTLTPFSNNGQLTSYPRRFTENPTPSREETIALDRRARAVNGDALVDLPNGVGFCLYITEACLAAVPSLPEVYAQGYYEDVEYCLAARERGFRSVAAPGVFVAHEGSKSFGARKRALVARNLELIEARFPGLTLETAAFVEVDPLAPFRAALDAAAAPAGLCVLLASAPGEARVEARRRAQRLKGEAPETTILRLEAETNGTLRLIAEGGEAPQSLCFAFDKPEDRDAFAAYLDRLQVERIELAGAADLPAPALDFLLRLDAEVLLLCADLTWFSAATSPATRGCENPGLAAPCESCRQAAAARQESDSRRPRLSRALERAAGVAPLDRLSEAFAQRVFKEKARPLAATPEAAAPLAGPPYRRLVAFSPRPNVTVDRLLLRLARRIAATGSDALLIVFGSCLDDSALMATTNAFVTGLADVDEYDEMARDYGADALLAPSRGGGFGDVDAVARRLGLAKAYFDWSFGALDPDPSDLSLDPRICEEKAAALILAWMNPSRLTAL